MYGSLVLEAVVEGVQLIVIEIELKEQIEPRYNGSEEARGCCIGKECLTQARHHAHLARPSRRAKCVARLLANRTVSPNFSTHPISRSPESAGTSKRVRE